MRPSERGWRELRAVDAQAVGERRRPLRRRAHPLGARGVGPPLAAYEVGLQHQAGERAVAPEAIADGRRADRADLVEHQVEARQIGRAHV